jgi:subtilisin family serine protease
MSKKHAPKSKVSIRNAKTLGVALGSVVAIVAILDVSVLAGEVLRTTKVKRRHLVPGKDFRDGELIIKYKTPASTSSVAHTAALSRISATRLRALNNSENVVHAKIPTGKSVTTAMAELAGDPNIEYVQPNYIYHVTATPNDTHFTSLWGLKNTGQTVTALSAANSVDPYQNPPTGSTTGKDMDLTHAWDTITDCSSVIVAVVDTGIKYDHADLAANMWDSGSGAIPNHGWNAITGASAANNPMDDNGHGTHVAGTIGAIGNNSIGSTGICWKTQLMAVKVLDSEGSGTTADIVTGINWAVSHGAKVINMSLGGSSLDPALSTAIDNARTSAGAVVVVAAGNDGLNNDSTPSYPCNFTKANMVCVAALDQAYGLASFSNYGATSVDVAAPGVNIASTWPFSVTATADDFSSGWNFSPSSGGWGTENLSAGGVVYPALVNPSNWNGSATYAANSDHHVYKTFNLSGAAKASIAYEVDFDTETNADFFRIYNSGSGGDPVSGGTMINIDSGSDAYYDGELPLSSSCLTATCSIGLRFTSNASVQATGVAFLRFKLKKSVFDTGSYNVIEGTSMATPHVTGLAAMLFAYNPNFTYTDVVAAIKNGGVSATALTGKTKTGKAVNAMTSLSYIQAPAGVGVVKN